MPNRSKKLIRIISIGLVTALFAGVVLSTQTKVVQAAEAFLEVQRDWTSSSTDSAKIFTILEVVDQKSEFSEDTDGNASITLGEEEIGYLIGGTEPFSSKYQELVNLSKEYSKTSNKQIEQAKVKAYYDALLIELQGQITTYNDDATVNVLAPLSLMEATSFQPTLAGYDKCLRLLENVSTRTDSPITEGWLVEDSNGVYKALVVDANDNPVSFTFAGEVEDTRILKLMRPIRHNEEESVSENSVSNNSVSENSMEEDLGDTKKEEQGSVSGNGDDQTNVPIGGDDDDETKPPLEGDVDDEIEPPSEGNDDDETKTPSEGDVDDEIESPSEGDIDDETETSTQGNSGDEVEIQSLGDDNNENENQDGDDDTTALLGYGKEIFFGKQIVLMSSVEGELDDSTESTDPTEPSVPSETANLRYSFYANQSDIPEVLKDVAIRVTFANSSTTEIIDDGTVNNASGNTATIDAIYQYRFVGIKNNEWFKTNVFGLDDTTFHNLTINVVTYTPAELTESIINSANLVYWNSKEVDTNESGSNSSGKDLSVTSAIALLDRINGADPIPCIVNHNSYLELNKTTSNSDGTTSTTIVNNNINKMLHLLYQNDIEETYKKADYGFLAVTVWSIDITSVGSAWETITNTVSVLNDGHFVRDNVYVLDHAINAISYQDANGNIILNGIKDPITGDGVEAGFDEVLYRIEREIYERQNTSGATSWDNSIEITPALAIQTILTYAKMPTVIEKSHLTVLELQPCYDFTYANGNEAAFKTKFLPADSNVSVEIIGMTTAQFCGMIEDINVKYDIIYIGSNTDLMNRLEITSGDYCTAYNDFNMYGVVYAHTGDLCQISGHGGSLASNENHTYRYSGNDILESQATDLINFLKSGAPVVVADDFFIKETVNNVNKITKINSGALKISGADGNLIDVTVDDTARGDSATGIIRNGILDSSSYVYQFVKAACANQNVGYGDANWSWENRKYLNFLTESEISNADDIEIFSRWINQPKMFIHMLSQPTEYNYTTKVVGKSHVIDDSSFLQKESDGNYYLTYEFYISSIASIDVQNTRYKVSLWIDTNMDGKFSDNSENLSDNELVITNVDTGDSVARDNLKTGVHYRVKRKLPAEIVGAVPWKIEIRNSAEDKSAIRNAATGITAVRVPEKQTIRVLQLYQGDANIQTYMQEENNHWNSLMNNVPDFNVEVTSIDATSFFNGSQAVDLDIYDMLIVGFADYYQGGTGFSKTVLSDLIEYAESGKCVLFTHDNTNWINTNAYNLNTTIRDISGLDRYAVSIYRNKTVAEYSKNYIKGGVDIKKDSKTELVDYLFGSDEMDGYERDIAFKVNTDQTTMDSRTQGLSYSGNEHDRFAFSGNEENRNATSPLIFKKGEEDTKYKDVYRYLNFDNALKETWINQNNHVIEKVNVGAITEFPYRLSDSIKVSSTHGQYFQLDLDSDKDGDEEGDIVVWYTLNDSKAGDLNDIYDYSPYDVRNNYYIYNRGNITYTGMGHSNIKDNEEEVKLFINTMIAAYRVAAQAPNLNIIEGNGDNTDKSFDAIPFDGNVSNNATTYNVYFKAEDVNLISESQKNIRCKIYMDGGSEVINVDGENINVTHKSGQATSGWKIFDTATNAEVTAVNDTGKNELYYPIISGREYYLQVPLVESGANGNGVVNLSETKSLDLYIEVQSFITKNNKVNESALIYDNFKLTQINLFDLD